MDAADAADVMPPFALVLVTGTVAVAIVVTVAVVVAVAIAVDKLRDAFPYAPITLQLAVI